MKCTVCRGRGYFKYEDWDVNDDGFQYIIYRRKICGHCTSFEDKLKEAESSIDSVGKAN